MPNTWKSEHGAPTFERDHLFILHEKTYKYSSKAFSLNCERKSYNLIEIPFNVSYEALELFIEALEKPEIEIYTQYIADLYLLCQLFEFSRLKCKLDEYYSKCDGKEKILDQQIISFNNGFETNEMEREIAKSIDEMIKYPEFYSLPPEILTRIVSKANLSSNNIVKIVQRFRSEGRDMTNYLNPYSMINYNGIENENKEFLLKECKESFPY